MWHCKFPFEVSRLLFLLLARVWYWNIYKKCVIWNFSSKWTLVIWRRCFYYQLEFDIETCEIWGLNRGEYFDIIPQIRLRNSFGNFSGRRKNFSTENFSKFFFNRKLFRIFFLTKNFSEKLNKTKTEFKKFPRFAQLHIHNIPGYVCLVCLVFSFLIRCCVCLAYLVANFSIWCDHLEILHHAI